MDITPTLTLAPRPFQWSNRQALKMTASPMETEDGHGCFDRVWFSSQCGFLSGCSGRVELAPNFAGACSARPTAAEFLRLQKVLCRAVSHPTSTKRNDNLTCILDCNLTYTARSGDQPLGVNTTYTRPLSASVLTRKKATTIFRTLRLLLPHTQLPPTTTLPPQLSMTPPSQH